MTHFSCGLKARLTNRTASPSYGDRAEHNSSFTRTDCGRFVGIDCVVRPVESLRHRCVRESRSVGEGLSNAREIIGENARAIEGRESAMLQNVARRDHGEGQRESEYARFCVQAIFFRREAVSRFAPVALLANARYRTAARAVIF